ncbi:M56 family metallopeptidase [Chitinophaga qingshengii]|uniref:M56 family metallopeptidase n=1 Tax=Chitinophaga qingshengii TaxID=1569794 RepID=A0ABR7TR25_9BACT|nr:M56 family metallopeptidase [Chitinophaga qingshengii]MBC9932445.1 M56 family metallopeptidase [Chitinophaga qingshengii]
MTPLIYLEKVVLCSALLYGYYHLALRNNRFHQWNRYYLVLITLVSLGVPLLKIPLPGGQDAPSAVYAYTSKIVVLRETVVAPAAQPSDYLRISITVIYALVVLFAIYRLLAGIFSIRRLIRHSHVQDIPPFRFARNPEVKAPFSFFRYIFWDMESSLDTPQNKQVLKHELVHLQEKHSLDKMLLEVITAFCWINPFFHLIKRELALVHEFIADKKAAGDEVAGYAENILRSAFDSPQFSITNEFFHPPIKRRILMLTQFRQPRFSYLRRILVLPLAATIFCSLAFVVDQRPAAIRALVPTGILPAAPSGNTVAAEAPVVVADTTPSKRKQEDARVVYVDNTSNLTVHPSFPGGQEELARFLTKNILYPKPAQEKGISGLVKVHFVVEPDGSITGISTINDQLGGGLEEEAIRIIKIMPRWKPGESNGKKVPVDYILPIRFTVQEMNPVVVTTSNKVQFSPPPAPAGNSSNEEIFTFVEHPPTFVGGEEELAKYLSKNIRYPKDAVEHKATGTIFVQFVVDKEGHIQQARTVGSKKGYGLEEEALRVVKEMPEWNAGVQNGRKVNVQFNLPIRFTMQ